MILVLSQGLFGYRENWSSMKTDKIKHLKETHVPYTFMLSPPPLASLK